MRGLWILQVGSWSARSSIAAADLTVAALFGILGLEQMF
jgi:hypothetical protein